MEFRYFSSVQGRAVQRFGKGRDAPLIGCKVVRELDANGRVQSRKYIWDEGAVVAIPEAEVRANLKSYRNALKRGDLVERTRQDYEARAGAPQTVIPGQAPADAAEPQGGAQAEQPATGGEDVDSGAKVGAGKRRRRSRGKRSSSEEASE